MIGSGACAGVFTYEFSSSILPRTKIELEKIDIPEHVYRSDLDYFLISIIPGLKHPALAYYEDLAPSLDELLSKTNQKIVDRGLCNSLKSLASQGIKDWHDVVNNVLKEVSSFKQLAVLYSIRIE